MSTRREHRFILKEKVQSMLIQRSEGLFTPEQREALKAMGAELAKKVRAEDEHWTHHRVGVHYTAPSGRPSGAADP